MRRRAWTFCCTDHCPNVTACHLVVRAKLSFLSRLVLWFDLFAVSCFVMSSKVFETENMQTNNLAGPNLWPREVASGNKEYRGIEHTLNELNEVHLVEALLV